MIAGIQAARQGTRLHAAPEAARTPNACRVCRERKVKCSGSYPCRFCSKRRLECVFRDSRKRKLYSVEYVSNLEARFRSANPATRPPDISSPGGASQASATGNVSCDAKDINEAAIAESCYTSIADPLGSSQNPTHLDHVLEASCVGPNSQQPGAAAVQTNESSHSAIFTDPALSSSVNFGSEVKAMPRDPWLASSHSSQYVVGSRDNAYGLFESPPNGLADSILWPSESDAEHLLSTVMSSLGKVQHLFDPRAFADRFSQDYTHVVGGTQPVDAWYVELLLVLAVGALLKGCKSPGESFPGAHFFIAATMRFPNMLQLRAVGTLGVEISGLSAFFLQCADRKDDAYVHAGMALRLSVSLGLFREHLNGHLSRSEAVHRNRLAWSVYMQEKRLAAATGNPSLISDSMISIARPVASPGFDSAVILNVNISIATITGQILETVYSHEKQPEESFVSGVREILDSLGRARDAMPPDCIMDFSSPLPLTRDCITLSLMLYQAIILTTRPALLHLAKARITNQEISERYEVFEKFSKNCIDAAERSLFVLCVARDQNLIATFGFFDLDGLFSVAFVFILAKLVSFESRQTTPIKGIELAMKLFEHLAERGNKAALNRKTDFEQMCNHAGVSLEGTGGALGEVQESNPLRCHTSHTPRYDPVSDNTHATVENLSQTGSFDATSPWQPENISFDSFFYSVPSDFYTVYQNVDLTLSGSVELDWEQLETIPTSVRSTGHSISSYSNRHLL